MQAKVGSAQKPTAGAPVTQPITGLGFAPNVVIFFQSTAVTQDTWQASIKGNLGFAANEGGTIKNRSAAFAVNDAAGVSLANRAFSNTKCINVLQGNGVATTDLLASAEMQSFDSDGFTLNWTKNNATAWRFNWLALQVPNVAVRNFDTSATGAGTITGLGFAPRAILAISNSGTAYQTTAPIASASLGWGVATTRDAWAYNLIDANATDPMSTSSAGQAGYFSVASPSSTEGTTITNRISLTSMDSDGLTYNVDNFGAARSVELLILGGISAWVETFNKSTAGAPATQARTSFGHQPKAVIAFSGSHITETSVNTAHIRASLGFSDGTNEVSGTFYDTDALATSNANAIMSSSKVVSTVTTNSDALASTADIAFDSNGVTFTWTTNDALAPEIFILSLGDIPITTSTRTISTAARVQTTLARQISAGARVQTTQARTITVKARVATLLLARQINAAARVIHTGNIRTITAAARVIRSGNTRTVTVAARVQTTNTRTITVKARVLTPLTRTVNAAARVQVTYARSMTTAARVIRAGNIRTINAAAILTPHRMLNAAARVVQTNNTRTLSCAARVTVPATVLAVLEPGNSRSQSTDPLTEGGSGLPTIVTDHPPDYAWESDGLAQVDFTELAAEIGITEATGAVAFWWRREAGGNTPDLVKLGSGSSAGSFFRAYHVGSTGVTVEYLAPSAGGGFQTSLALPSNPATDEWSFIYFDWSGPTVRASRNAGTLVGGTRARWEASGFGDDIVTVLAYVAASHAATVGPVLIASEPLTQTQIQQLYERTSPWTLTMGTTGWSTTEPRLINAAARVIATTARTLNASARVQTTNARTINAAANVTLPGSFTRVINVAARVVAPATRTLSAAARVQTAHTLTLQAAARVQTSHARTLEAAARVQFTHARTIDVAAHVITNPIRTINAAARVSVNYVRAVNTAARVVAQQSRTINVAARVEIITIDYPQPTLHFTARVRPTAFVAPTRPTGFIARRRKADFTAGEES